MEWRSSVDPFCHQRSFGEITQRLECFSKLVQPLRPRKLGGNIEQKLVGDLISFLLSGRQKIPTDELKMAQKKGKIDSPGLPKDLGFAAECLGGLREVHLTCSPSPCADSQPLLQGSCAITEPEAHSAKPRDSPGAMSGLNVIRKEIPLGSVSGLSHESHSWLIDPDGVKDIPAEGTAHWEEEEDSLGNANFCLLLE